VGLGEGMPKEVSWSILEKGDDGIVVLDASGSIVFSNSVFASLTGFERSDIVKHSFYDFVTPEQQDSLRSIKEILRERQGKFCREITFLRKDGSQVVTETCFSPDYDQTPPLMYVYVRDMSEWKRIEGELKKANSFFVNLIESSVDGIIAADIKGNIIIFNHSAEQLTGYKAEEVIGGKLHITNIYPVGVAKDIMQKLRSEEYGGVGKLTPIRITVLSKEGEEIPIELSAALVYEEGREIASVGIFTDLRERLRPTSSSSSRRRWPLWENWPPVWHMRSITPWGGSSSTRASCWRICRRTIPNGRISSASSRRPPGARKS